MLIGLYDVSRRFDNGRIVALDHVTLEVEAGAAIALAGRSGCGKTTLLHVMSGLGRPDSGSVAFDGRSVANAGDWRWLRAHRIGIVFQHFNLLPMLTAAENVEAPMLGIERLPSVRRRSPVASGSGSRSHAAWPIAPICCWQTNPREISTAPLRSQSLTCCFGCTANSETLWCSSLTMPNWPREWRPEFTCATAA